MLFESEAFRAAAEREETKRASATIASMQSEEQRIVRQSEARVNAFASEKSANQMQKEAERMQKTAAEHQAMVKLVEQARREEDQAKGVRGLRSEQPPWLDR